MREGKTLETVTDKKQIPSTYINSSVFGRQANTIQAYVYRGLIPGIRYLSKGDNKRGVIYVDEVKAIAKAKDLQDRLQRMAINAEKKKRKEERKISELHKVITRPPVQQELPLKKESVAPRLDVEIQTITRQALVLKMKRIEEKLDTLTDLTKQLLNEWMGGK